MSNPPGPSPEAVDWFRTTLLDDAQKANREKFLATMLAIMTNIETWAAIDSWLGGGRVAQVAPGTSPPENDGFGLAFSEFRAVSTVICMSVELAESAVAMARANRFYAVGACLRQMIECEYLLVWFNEDLDNARRWRESSPDDVRRSFTPQKMRNLTGFANEEYWDHCATGGHPAPKGARLLEKLDPLRTTWPYSAAELTIDLGLHIRRIWRAADSLLATHHARYTSVRADEREQAEGAWQKWKSDDPIADFMTKQG